MYSSIFRLCFGIWREADERTLGVRNIGRNWKIFHIF